MFKSSEIVGSGVCFIVEDSDPVEVVKVQQYFIVVYSTVNYPGVCFIVQDSDPVEVVKV